MSPAKHSGTYGSLCPGSVCLSDSQTFLVVTHSYVSQATHAFLGMLPLCFCLHFEMKGLGSRVNLVKHEAFLKDLHATCVLSYSNVKKKEEVYFVPYIYAKATNKALVEKINVNFSVT